MSDSDSDNEINEIETSKKTRGRPKLNITDEERRIKHNSYMLEKIKCKCGSMITRCNLSKHKKTNKHKKFFEDIKLECGCGETVCMSQLKKHNKSEDHILWDKNEKLSNDTEIHCLCGEIVNIKHLKKHNKTKEHLYLLGKRELYCACGEILDITDLAKHNKSKQHQEWKEKLETLGNIQIDCACGSNFKHKHVKKHHTSDQHLEWVHDNRKKALTLQNIITIEHIKTLLCYVPIKALYEHIEKREIETMNKYRVE